MEPIQSDTYIGSVPLILLGIISTSIAFLFYTRPRHLKEYPVMPCRPFPILGHLPYLVPPLPAIMKWKKECGDIYSVYMGNQLFIMIAGYEVLKEAFVRKAGSFSNRPDTFSITLFRDVKKDIRGLTGPFWREHRNASVSVLREFGMGTSLMADKIQEEAVIFLDRIAKNEGEPMNLRRLSVSAFANVTYAIFIGRRFDHEDPDFNEMIDLMRELSKIIQLAGAVDVFKFLEHFPGDPCKAKRLREISTFFLQFFSKQTEASKEKLYDKAHDNFLKAYLRLQRKAEEAGQETHLKDEELSSLGVSFIFAGFDSTSNTILWTIVCCLHYPEIQEKVFKEIQAVVGTSRLPTMHDRKQMPYTNAFILETQRFGNIAPLTGHHLCSKTSTLAGYTIPEGAVILPVLEGVMKDEKLWGDPWAFRPERFLDQDGVLQVPEYHIPYFIGKRACVGMEIAKMELFLFITMIYQRFEILPADPNNLPNLVADVGFTASPMPFDVRLVERNKA